MNSTKIIIRDLRLDMLIGVHDYEKEKPQPVLVNIEADITNRTGGDTINDTVCYDAMIGKIKNIAASGHIHLVETYAEKIAEDLFNDKRIGNLLVRVEKTSVYDFAGSVGVEIRKIR